MDVYVRFRAYSMCLVPVLFVCTAGQKEPFVTIYEACNGVILKPLNRTFCCVHTTIVRFYQLYYCFLVFTVFLDCLGSYIFNYIENRFEILFSQLCYVVLECCYCWFILQFFTGVSRMTLYDQSYITQIAVFPLIDLIGNFSLNLMYIVLSFVFSAA